MKKEKIACQFSKQSKLIIYKSDINILGAAFMLNKEILFDK